MRFVQTETSKDKTVVNTVSDMQLLLGGAMPFLQYFVGKIALGEWTAAPAWFVQLFIAVVRPFFIPDQIHS